RKTELRWTKRCINRPPVIDRRSIDSASPPPLNARRRDRFVHPRFSFRDAARSVGRVVTAAITATGARRRRRNLIDGGFGRDRAIAATATTTTGAAGAGALGAGNHGAAVAAGEFRLGDVLA